MSTYKLWSIWTTPTSYEFMAATAELSKITVWDPKFGHNTLSVVI